MTRRFDRDLLRVGGIACVVAVFSLLYYFDRGRILLYGDAAAHLNIARRVFDSQTPGLLQLGTVWLPLPHLLMIPLLLSDSLWQSGLGGSIPSMIAYLLGVVGAFRLARGVLDTDIRAQGTVRFAGWVAALAYGLNPNLIYLQATAMTESMYLALFVWAVVYVVEFLKEHSPSQNLESTLEDTPEGRPPMLWKGLACVAGAELTRYDGWFLAAVMGGVVALFLLLRWKDAAFRRAGLKFLLGIVILPALWVAYNGVVYRNPWEFISGPYSAKTIERQSGARNPAEGSVFVAGRYFLKSAQLNIAPGNWGRLWLAVALAALAFSIWKRAFLVPLALLWTPLVFYALSIAHGGVPLYVPSWWPFTWYNIRYGVQLLPLFAICAGILVHAVLRLTTRYGSTLAAAVCGLVILSYASVWRAQPLCLTEAIVNSRTRLALEGAVARAILPTPPHTRFLMYLGNHVGIFPQAGIPLRQVINEGNHRPWKKPSDPEGLWERALADPPLYVDYVITFEGDAVDRGVNRNNLILLSEIHTTGQPRARIYRCVAETTGSSSLR